jgi:hypothetical protein
MLFLSLLVVGVLSWPGLKTLPRRAVAQWLTIQLGAAVELQELTIQSRQHFVLRGLSMDFPTALPGVEHAFVHELVVEAGLRQLLGGHLEVLTLRGVELRLRPTPLAPNTSPTQTPTIGKLHLEPAQVTITSLDGSEKARLTLQIGIENFGETDPEATILHLLIVTSEELSLRPLAELARIQIPTTLSTTVSDLKIDLRHSEAGDELDLHIATLNASFGDETLQGVDLDAALNRRDGILQGILTSKRLHGVLAGFPFDLPGPALSLTAKPKDGEEGLLEITFEPRFSGLGQGHFAAVVHPAEFSWRTLEATVEGTRWETLWPALNLEAQSDLHLVDDGQNLRVHFEIHSPKIHHLNTKLVLEDLNLTFQGLTSHPNDLRIPPTFVEIQSLALTLGDGRLGETSLPRHVEAKGHLQAKQWPSLEAEILFSEIELFSDLPHHLKLESLRLDLASSQATDFSQLRLRALETTGSLGLPPQLPVLPFKLHASGYPLPEAGFELKSALLEFPSLGNLEAVGSWRPGENGGRAHLQYSEVDFARWQSFLSSKNLGFSWTGQGAGEFDAVLEMDGRWRLSGPARLRDVGFTSEDGGRVMEGLSSELELLVQGTGGTPKSATAKGQLGGFVLLWGTFFGDFLDLSSQIEVEAEAEDGFSSWRLGADINLHNLIDFHAEVEHPASAPNDELTFGLTFTAEDLQAAQQELLVRFEGLEKVDMGGQLKFQAEGRFRALDHWNTMGSLSLNDFRWKGDQATINGLDLYLPLALEQRGGEFRGRRLLGDLRFNQLTLRDLEIPPLASALWVEADSLGLSEPLEVPVFGGRIVLEGLGASRLLREDRSVESGLRLEALDLARIAADLELFPLEGTLDGNFPRILLHDNDMEIDGGGRIELFGGTVEIRDIRGKNIFTPFPELTLSSTLRDIDLGRLTRRIDFGEMTGILQGEINTCRLFRGIPVTCQATFRTEERPEVKGTVDIKAVKNLTILSTGQNTSILDRGVQRFLKRFTYSALGVELSLADDVLLMRGLEKRGERELFLRGRLPFPIDIVNAQPGGAVSFQAMLQRFQTLDFSQVETKP